MSNFVRVGKDLIINLDAVSTASRGRDATYVYFIGEQTDHLKLEGEKATALWNFFIVSSPNICPDTPAATERESAETLSIQNSEVQNNQ